MNKGGWQKIIPLNDFSGSYSACDVLATAWWTISLRLPRWSLSTVFTAKVQCEHSPSELTCRLASYFFRKGAIIRANQSPSGVVCWLQITLNIGGISADIPKKCLPYQPDSSLAQKKMPRRIASRNQLCNLTRWRVELESVEAHSRAACRIRLAFGRTTLWSPMFKNGAQPAVKKSMKRPSSIRYPPQPTLSTAASPQVFHCHFQPLLWNTNSLRS